MKAKLFLLSLGACALCLPALAQSNAAGRQVPVVPAAPTDSPAPETYVYEQKPMGGRQPLVTAEQAQGIVDRFKAAYPKMGNPRFLVYVNRELVDENSGLKIIARTEKVDSTRQRMKSEGQTNAAKANSSSETRTTSGENRYKLNEKSEPTLADRQTVRDVERLFGRPLRMAGASLADQRMATQLMADKRVESLQSEGEQARKDREALSKIADVAIEVLISSKNVQVTELSGDRTYTLPDIQATAISLKDARIVSQASSSDVIRGNPAYYARNFDVREITEATALALMEDMLTSASAQHAEAKPEK